MRILRPHSIQFACGCLLGAALTAASLPAFAVAVITVTDPWVRVAPNGKSAEAFMEVMSSEGGTIVRIESDASIDMSMQSPGRQRGGIGGIALPAGKQVKLEPGAYRLFLPKLNRALKLGDRVALSIVVQGADGVQQTVPINAEVRRRSAYDDHLHPHTHSH